MPVIELRCTGVMHRKSAIECDRSLGHEKDKQTGSDSVFEELAGHGRKAS